MKILEVIKQRKKTFTLAFLLTFFSYIILLVITQWIITGKAPSSLGVFSNPPGSEYANYKDFVILWIGSKHYVEKYEFEWLTTINLLSFSLLIILSLTSALNFSLSSFLNSYKKGAACSVATSIAGLSFITPAISACPSCGTAIVSSIVQGIVFAATGTTLGVSALIVQLTSLALFIGILLNSVIFYYLLKKSRNNKENLIDKWRSKVQK